jgi:hypothetical protein
MIQVATFKQRTHVILHVHGSNFQSTTTLPLSIDQEEFNLIELERDFNPNPQNGVAHCSLILTYN